MQLVDSHCHINFDPLAGDMPGVLERARKNRVDYLLCVSVCLEDFPEIAALSASHDYIFASVGVHPNYRDCREPSVEELIALAEDDGVVAVGETGLDYFRSEGDLTWQRERFERHIEAAKSVGKPLIIHTRQAAEDTMDMLEGLGADSCRGVMHCFSEDWKTASRALDIGFFLSFSGIVTFRNADVLREVARKAPPDRILVETDAPYLAPVPLRGKTNEPSFVVHTAECVAALRNVSCEAFARQTTENFFNLFSHARRRSDA
ncbi:MAG: TatD family deoxyribonuclease [Gammaproteobacteria bacterium]|nr:TatD family deoxyribonuclease [Gammaproteobacteria bacterium]MYD77187.1 TatD family deoxyribonuclease [Gammaproteobacteria bacterium]MYJ52510.1 TatD family deoxyribonuclease [Gammaproteobacteria bacterium]